MTLLKGIEAGADIVDTALSPFAETTSHPCTESLVYTLKAPKEILASTWTNWGPLRTTSRKSVLIW